MITDLQLRHLKGKLSEPLGYRGMGRLQFRRRSTGQIEAYYVYAFEGSPFSLKIGAYDRTGIIGFTLAHCRKQAQEFAALHKEHPHLKRWLEEEQRRIEREQAAAAACGTFADLIDSYVDYLRTQNRSSADAVQRELTVSVKKAFPELARKRACDVIPDDIVDILRGMLERGVTTGANRLRSMLLTAFNRGLRADNDPRHISKQGKRFRLTFNPVAAVPTQPDFERARDRVLTKDELRALWTGIDIAPAVGALMADLVRLLIATGGQRPKQLLAAPWTAYDFERNVVTIVDRKGRGARARQHLVPLTSRAIEILARVRRSTGHLKYPFACLETTPFEVNALGRAIARYREFLVDQARTDGRPEPEHFMGKDIRRTIKNVMIDAGIGRDVRNLIQNHGLTGVDYRYYDKSDHLHEKREGLAQYDKYLEKLLNPPAPPPEKNETSIVRMAVESELP